MAFDPSEYRRIMGHWVTGVSIVAVATSDGEPRGLTANAVSSVSLDPPLVLVCIDHTADSHDAIATADGFSVNILASDQERLARRFAAFDLAHKFEGIAWHVEQTGAPILDDALAWVDCRTRERLAGGDHSIFIGEVVAGDAREGGPLIYYRGGYGRFVP
jgi:flavin reductase (DIM6/NTAB) family NADH-FMN oxidoreductase RutF